MCSEIFAEIASVRYNLDSICTIISDDGFPLTVEELYKLSAKYKIKLTVAQTIINISDIERLQTIEKSNRIEFISHSFSHLNMGADGISEKTLYHEIIESKEYMEKNFITHQIAFVPPNNQLSKDAYSICKNCFYAIRRWVREFNSLSPDSGIEPLNWLNLGCKGIRDVRTTQERNRWIDECINQKKWLIEMWHDIKEFSENTEGYQTISPIEAEEHMAYICEKRDKEKIWIASFVDAVKYILEKQTINIDVLWLDDNRWRISLTGGISEIDPRFDMPLSVLINIPGKLNNIIIEGKKVNEYSEEINDTDPIMIEMLPGEKVDVLVC